MMLHSPLQDRAAPRLGEPRDIRCVRVSCLARKKGPDVVEALEWLQQYHPFFEVTNAAGSLLAVITWLIAIPLILRNWWRGKGVQVEFNLMGVRAAALFGGAAEQWAARTPGDHPKAKAATVARTLARAFDMRGRSQLKGKKILWVDDQPSSVALEIQGFGRRCYPTRRY